MYPQPHPYLHFLVRLKPTSTNVFFQVAKNVEVTRAKIWAAWRMSKYFPAKSLKLIPHQIRSRGRALSCKRMIPCDSIPGRFDFMAHRSTLSQQETKQSSLLFFAYLHFQCWTNTLYTTLTSRSIKKQLRGSVRSHFVCLLPYSTGAQKWHIVSLQGDVTSPTTVADYVIMTCSEHREALTAAPIADGVHLQAIRM